MDTVINNVDSHRSENTNTTREAASQRYIIVALHTILPAIIGIFGFCIQLKFPNGSPYATVYGSRLMNTFIIEICTYLVSLVVMAISAGRNNADLEDLMNKVCIFCGTLPMTLELLVLIKPFGWFTLSVWSICFSCFVYNYGKRLLTLCENAVKNLVQTLGVFRQTLVDWNSRRRTRKDESNNTSVSNGERAIELHPQNLNISNDRGATEHQSQNQNLTSVGDHLISVHDSS